MLFPRVMDDQPENRQANRLVASGLYNKIRTSVMSACETLDFNVAVVTTDSL